MRFLALTITAVLSFSAIPVAANASGAVDSTNSTCDLSGDGTSASPHVISERPHIREMRDCDVSGETRYFDLATNIDLRGENIEPISFSSSSTVVIDGKGYSITGLSIFEDRNERGLFGETGDLTVKNLNMVAGVVYGGGQTAALAGSVNGDLVVENSNFEVGLFSGKWESGIVAGRVDGNATLSDVMVYVEKIQFGDSRGGIVIGRVSGDMTKMTRVYAESDSFVMPSIEGQATIDDSPMGIGGLAGAVESFQFEDVYAELRDHNEGNNAPVTRTVVGGLVGLAEPAVNSYVKGGQTLVDAGYVEHFGGGFGVIKPSVTEKKVNLENVLFNAFVELTAGGSGNAGGIIGKLDNTGISFTFETKHSITRMHITDPDVGDVSGYTVAPELIMVSMENFTDSCDDGLYDSTSWDDYTNTGDATTSDAGDLCSSITTEQLKDKANLPADFQAEIGEGGADFEEFEWEACDGSYPRISWVPSPCSFPTDRVFSTVSESYEINKPITPITVTNDDNGRDEISRYTISPSLPAGLSIDLATGTISGTPEEVTPLTRYSIRHHYLQGSSADSISFATVVPPDPAPQIIRDTVVIEKEVPAEYAGPLITTVSKQLLASCTEETVTLRGQHFDKLDSALLGTESITHRVKSSSILELDIPCLEAGKYDLTFTSSTGDITYEQIFEVLGVTVSEIEQVEGLGSDQVLNAGSFKGYVAVYAKGYEGQRLSAKIGDDWVIVPSLESNFERVTDFTGAGVEIQVRIFIDRELKATIPLTTR